MSAVATPKRCAKVLQELLQVRVLRRAPMQQHDDPLGELLRISVSQILAAAHSAMHLSLEFNALRFIDRLIDHRQWQSGSRAPCGRHHPRRDCQRQSDQTGRRLRNPCPTEHAHAFASTTHVV
jgi:hypothetical protein